MPESETIRVLGYREFLRASDRAGRESKVFVRAAFRTAGEAVRVEGAGLFEKYDARSAAGFRVSVRQQGVFVYQGLRKTTGKRPDYGSLQMRKALLPALQRKETATVAAIESALDLVADHFDH